MGQGQHVGRKQGDEVRMKLSGLDSALADLLDLHFIDAPNAASGPIPDDVSNYFEGPYYEEDDRWSYEGWERSLQHIADVCALHGPFDGVLGFSQGAAMACLLCGMQRSGFALRAAPRLRFVVAFAGIKARDPQLERCYAAMRACPSLHIVGDRDPVKGMTNRLIGEWEE
eukprot:scaffold6.g2778.t1